LRKQSNESTTSVLDPIKDAGVNNVFINSGYEILKLIAAVAV